MVLTGIPISWSLLTGAVALAILVVLQHLLQQSPRRRIVSILFWPARVPTNPARVLWDRFLRIGSFLILLAIIVLLALSLAGPETKRAGVPVVVVVDAGIHSSTPEKMQNHLADLFKRVRQNQDLTVIVADPEPQVVLASNEPHGLSFSRVKNIHTADAPANTQRGLQMAYQLVRHHADGQIWFVSNDASMIHECGNDVERRIKWIPAGQPDIRPVVTSLVFTPSDQDPHLGHIHVKLMTDAARLPQMRVVLESDAGAVTAERIASASETQVEFVSPVLAADGNKVKISVLGSDSAPAISPILWQLPNSKRIAVNLDEHLPLALRAAVQANYVEPHQAGDGVIAVCDLDHMPVNAPAIVLLRSDQTSSSQLQLLKTVSSHKLVSQLDFESARAGATDNLVNRGSPLVVSGDKALISLDESGPFPRLYLSEDLFASQSDAARRLAFVTLISRTLRMFANTDVAPIAITATHYYQDPAGFAASALAPVLLDNFPGDMQRNTNTEPEHAGFRFPTELWFWILITAFAVMMIEAILHIRGRIV